MLGAFLLHRRELLEELGGFDDAYRLYCEDIDLCYRAALAGWERWYVPGAVVEHAYPAEIDRGLELGLGHGFESRVHRPELDRGADRRGDPAFGRNAFDPRAVARAEVADPHRAAFDDDLGVAARDRRVRDPHVGLGRRAEQMLPFGERVAEGATSVLEDETDDGHGRIGAAAGG